MQTIDKTASKFRDMASRLEKDIANKTGPRLENTPKRQREAASARIDGNHLERVRVALQYLADAREEGALPPELAGIKSKTELLDMLRTRLNSHGYYHICDTGEFHDQSEIAKTLRLFIESRKTGADRQKEVEDLQRQAIAELEAKIRFANIPGFFPTPKPVIERMLELADIQEGNTVLEPSAGKGDIAEAIHAKYGFAIGLTCIEINQTLREILAAKGLPVAKKTDFLGEWCTNLGWPGYDRIVMNPPFEHGQDIDHVMYAYDEQLAPGGRLVSVMSAGPFFRSDGKSARFRVWLESVNAYVEDLPDGSFESAFVSTGVSTKLVTIRKPKET